MRYRIEANQVIIGSMQLMARSRVIWKYNFVALIFLRGELKMMNAAPQIFF